MKMKVLQRFEFNSVNLDTALLSLTVSLRLIRNISDTFKESAYSLLN